jgi:hypothetical protein
MCGVVVVGGDACVVLRTVVEGRRVVTAAGGEVVVAEPSAASPQAASISSRVATSVVDRIYPSSIIVALIECRELGTNATAAPDPAMASDRGTLDPP